MSLIISLGSNLGNRTSHLISARKILELHFEVIAYSSIIESSPVDFLEQPMFLNQVVECALPPQDPFQVLTTLQKIELEIGRKKTFPKGPRTIDLDIIFFGNIHIKHPNLQIPHPHWHLRPFVYQLLKELPFGQQTGVHYGQL